MKVSLLIFLIITCLAGSHLWASTISLGYTDSSQVHARIVATARSMLGVPYRWSGTTRAGVDCSGLVYYVFREAAGRSLPRIVADLMQQGQRVSGTPGVADLLFFDTDGKGYPSHVGISLGGDKFIHAASAGSKTGVIISSLEEKYYRPRFLEARRLVRTGYPEVNISLDPQKVRQDLDAILQPGIPVYFNISSSLEKPDFLIFEARRGREVVITKRFRNHLQGMQARTWFIPDTGGWTITLSDDINGELAVIQFTGSRGG